ncbi:MAG: HAD family hydrolase [Planctomycetota bacterium]|nr:MAG: HAD family hydrolase [Planctomycetota bacterium]
MVTAVIFDLDDTLYDELDYCRSGFASVADFLSGLPQTPPADRIFDSLSQQFNAGNHKTTFNAALDDLAINYDDNLIAQLVETYRTHVPKITLPSDSQDVLNRLSDKFTLALLTDGFLPAQQLKVQALGIEKYFNSIVYSEELGREFWKPSPVAFEKIIHDLNTTPQNTACVADNEKKDFIAPNNLGCTTIQLIRPNRLHTKSSSDPHAAAHHIIQNITHLPPLLQNL